jgi:hypothetical protein
MLPLDVRVSDKVKVVPVAAPIFGVTSVGEVARTTPPVPVDADVEPVPPFATGRAVPEYETENPPFEFSVTGEPDTERNEGTFIEMVLLPRVVMSAPRATMAAVFAETIVVRPVTGVYKVVLIASRSALIKPISVVSPTISASMAVILALKAVDKFNTPDVILKSSEVDVINGVDHEREVPFDVRICPIVPIVVRPVPPFAVGNAVPVLYVILIDGVGVGFVTVTLRNDGTEAETVVTVPVVGYFHAGNKSGPTTSIVST